jgi:hypothetical protein
MRSKRKAQKAHARRRAAERFGICLTNESYRDLVRQIQSNQAKFVEKQSNRVTLWEVDFAGKKAVAVYDKSRHTVITLWDKEIWDRNRKRRQASDIR